MNWKQNSFTETQLVSSQEVTMASLYYKVYMAACNVVHSLFNLNLYSVRKWEVEPIQAAVRICSVL